MDSPDPRTGQHGVCGLGNHRQINGDAIALADAQRLQHIGATADLFVQRAIAYVLRRRVWIIGFPDDRDIIAALGQMTVNAIGGNVENAVFKPFDRHIRIFERGVLDLFGKRHPIQTLGLFAPKSIRIGDRALVHFIVLLLGRMGACDRSRTWLEYELLAHSILPYLSHHRSTDPPRQGQGLDGAT